MSVDVRRSPERAVHVTIGLAWVVIVGVHAALPTSAVGPEVSPGGTAVGSVIWGTAALAWPLWIVMSIAMMVPAALPAVRHVADNSFRWRRHRAVATFLGSYVAVWAVFGVVALAGLTVWNATIGPLLPRQDVPLLAALAVAVVWQLTPWKRRHLRGCLKSIPLAPRGWKAFRSCARFGARYGGRCTGTCWAVMLIMATVTTGHLWWSIALTAVIVAERSLAVLRRHPHLVAVAGVGVLALLVLNAPTATASGPAGWFCTLPPQ